MKVIGSVLVEALMNADGEVRYRVSMWPAEDEWPLTFTQALDRVEVLLIHTTLRARQRNEFTLPGWDLT